MFIGHYGVALWLKKFDSKLSLGWLFLAVQLVDFFWSILVFFGIEKVTIVPGITEANPMDFVYYPFTHSLVAFIVWSSVIYLLVKILHFNSSLSKKSLGLLLGFAVFSHFLLDVIVHRPDLPLLGSDSFKLGLGLWNNVFFAYALETLIFVGGVYIYYKVKSPMAKSRKIGLLVFTVLLLIMNLINLFSVPPDNIKMIAVSGFMMYLLFSGFGFWLDKNLVSENS